VTAFCIKGVGIFTVTLSRRHPMQENPPAVAGKFKVDGNVKFLSE